MKVLIVRTGAMGDVLHALPAAAALRAAQPTWQIDWLVDPRWLPLLQSADGHAPLLDHVHLAETRLWSRAPLASSTLQSILTLRRLLREQRYDIAVDVQGTLRSAVLARFTGARIRTGFVTPRELAARLFYTRAIARMGRHIVEQNTALLASSCELPLSPLAAPLPHEPVADEHAADLVAEQPICLLAPSAGWPAKCWPAKRYGLLAQSLRRQGFRVLVNAGSSDDAVAQSVIAASHNAAELFVSSIAELIAMVRRAALIVGGDSGPVHLAATLETPHVALFGPTDPVRNGPWLPPETSPRLQQVLRHSASRTTYKRSSVLDPGLAHISVEDVLDALQHLSLRK